MEYKSKSNWGDYIGSQLKGPEWTPYAQAIAERYPTQVPWFYTLRANDPPGNLLAMLTAPQQDDVLILGIYAIVLNDFDEGNFLLLQITHKETGIPWVVPNAIGFAPLPALAGTVNPALFPNSPNRTTLLKLPEAFFLPRHNQLKLDWFDFFPPSFPVVLTFAGIRLIGEQAPKEVIMPNGNVIPAGSRLPWFSTIPLGDLLRSANITELPALAERVQFTTSQDCGIEIHDAYQNGSAFGATSGFVERTGVKLTEMATQHGWTPTVTPAPVIFGDELQVNPALPFTRPLLLEAGRRIAVMQLAGAAPPNVIDHVLLTFRGVRLCEY